MKAVRVCKLCVVMLMLSMASCAIMNDEIDARGYAAIGIFMPDDEGMSDALGSQWITLSVGGIGPLEMNEQLLGRAEIAYTFASGTTAGFGVGTGVGRAHPRAIIKSKPKSLIKYL